MKNLLILFLLVATFATAQTGSIKYNQITGADLNEVTYKLDGFAGRKMRLTKKGDQEFAHKSEKQVLVTQRFQKFNAPDKTLTVVYNTTPVEHRMYINDITITGNKELLIEFFVKFWNTDINLDTPDRDPLATSRFLNDEVALYTGTDRMITVTAAE